MDAKDNVQAIIEAARATGAVTSLPDGSQAMLIPNGYQMVKPYTPPLAPVPARIAARPAFHDGDSLARYATRYSNKASLLVADIEASKIAIHLDYPEAGEPTAREHSATWAVQYSEQMAAWDKIEGKMHEQGEFLAFLEENADDVITPAPAVVLDLVRDFSATKEVTFDSSRRLDNGDRAVTFIEKTNAKRDIEIPRQLTLEIPIYYGEETHNLRAWFRTRINNGALFLGIEWHRLEPVKQAAFRAAVTRVAEVAGLDPFYGAV